MKYEIKLEESLPQHWYWINGKKLVPSTTTILSYYPKSAQLISWMQEKGAMEAERIRDEAGSAGTTIHYGCEQLIGGRELNEVDYSKEEWKKLLEATNRPTDDYYLDQE